VAQEATELYPDRIQPVLALGSSSLELSLMLAQEELAHTLATISDLNVSGGKIDDK
jgi:molecular chaperone DnaK (HSP70)